ncbi:MAG TPA: ABC transporter ATP-binding protein [Thermoanaerobaculia bacterium]
MSRTAIRVEDLAKRYKIGERQEPYKTLRDVIATAAVQPFRRLAAALRGESARVSKSSIWALDGVSFEVEEGEVVGIIGHNGAGKTTLLKVLSRITEPTRGRAEIHGRVGSLLEVGTGFHPELTGRENVFLNGAILGMRRSETAAKFDRIVEFAEVGSFIDTPVKFFSSGMYVRLAFAVAAHLEPEVLLVDEVLAVGDASFQRKCIRSIRESTEGGRTALVVSHNMAFMRSLCSRTILLSRGRVVADGPTDEVIGEYHRSFAAEDAVYRARERPDERPVAVSHVLLRGAGGAVATELPCGDPLTVEIGLDVRPGAGIPRPWIGVRLYSWHGELLAHVANREAGFELPPVEGPATVTCTIEGLNLLPGEYHLGVVVADTDNRVHDQVNNALAFTLTPADVFGSGMLPSARQGQIWLASRWGVEAAAERDLTGVGGRAGSA